MITTQISADAHERERRANLFDTTLAAYHQAKQDRDFADAAMNELKAQIKDQLGYFGDSYRSEFGSVQWRAGSTTRTCDYKVIDAVAAALEGSNPSLAAMLRNAITSKQNEPTLVVKVGGDRER